MEGRRRNGALYDHRDFLDLGDAVLRTYFMLSFVALAAAALLSISNARADEEPFHFCAGDYVEEMQANAVLVLRADMAAIQPKAKKDLNCELPNADETTLLRLIISGKNEDLEASLLQYWTEFQIADQPSPVRIMVLSTFYPDWMKRRYEVSGRLCGYETLENGLQRRAKVDQQPCSSKSEFLFGRMDTGQLFEISCQPGHSECVLSADFGGWNISAIADKQVLLTYWREFSRAFTDEITNRVVLNFTPDGCEGDACALLERLIKQK